MRPRAWLAATAYLLVSTVASAASPSTSYPRLATATDSPRVRLELSQDASLRVGGYLETYYSWNFNRPSNGISEFRAFDNRHNAISLQAAALDVGFKSRYLEARFVGQTGTGPATYYGASEPSLAGSALTPASAPNAWQHVQQAWLAWSPVPERLVVDAGIFLSPIGPENMATYQNFHWSHSIMFFALPFYHAGARVRWSPSSAHALRVALYNGWNNVGDNNAEKTFAADYTYSPRPGFTLGAASFTGVERPTAAPEGRAWRQLFDVYSVWAAHPRLTLLGELDGGFEPNRFGISAWAAGNLSSRVRILDWLYFAGRGTLFAEHRASDGASIAAPIAIPAGRITSGTLTVETIPVTGLSFKLETRYDNANRNAYFTGRVAGTGSGTSPFVVNARDQLTVTLGASAWF